MRKFQFMLSLIAMATMTFLVGCGSDSKDDKSKKNDGEHVHKDGSKHKDHKEDKGHSHGEGPHGGAISDWGGGKYHVEFTVNHDKQEATVYILGDDAKAAAAVEAKELTLTIKEPALTTTLKASPQEGDGDGKASRFIGNHEGLGVVREYEGTISGKVGDTPYSGNFKEVAQ